MTPKTDLKYSLIFLHGLGDTAMGFLDMFEDTENELQLTPPNCRIVLPTAPTQAVTINDGFQNENEDGKRLSKARLRPKKRKSD